MTALMEEVNRRNLENQRLNLENINIPPEDIELLPRISDKKEKMTQMAEEVAKKPDIGYEGDVVFPEIDIPSDLSDSGLESMEKYSGEMANIPKGDMMDLMKPDLMKPDFKMEAGINQRDVRKKAYNRYKTKKQKQRANPTIRYKSRKKIADNRTRVKGRFVKSGDKTKSGYKKLTKSQMKSKKKTKTKAKRDLMKAKKTLKRALARYNKVMKM